MQLPKPKMLTSAKRQTVTTFYGLDRTDLCGEDTSDGESYFSEMKNGGSSSFPFAASREGRTKIAALNNPANALLGTDKLAYVDGTRLIYDGREVMAGLIDGEKRLVAFGAYILIYPDQKYYNTVTGESGAMETVETVSGTCGVLTSKFIYANDSRITTDDSGKRYIAVNYRGAFGMIKISLASPIFDSPTRRYVSKDFLKDNLYLRISNGKIEYVSDATIIRAYSGEDADYKLSNPIWSQLPVSAIPVSSIAKIDTGYLWNGDYPITLTDGILTLAENGNLSQAFSKYTEDTSAVTLEYNWTKSNMPRLDYVCALDNRLWGCRYGMQAGSNTAVNEIYCSALGDFKNWSNFQGISTDPWCAGVAEPGMFTGAVAYGGHPIFFKEDCAYAVSGSYPPYSYTLLRIDGVARGAARSICEVGGALYYKSRGAVMRYTSSSLASVSVRLGSLPDAVRAAAGSYSGKYYLSLDGTLYVYDTARCIWCEEDDCAAVGFATAGGKLYIAAGKENADGKYLLSEVSGEPAAEADMPWSFTTPIIGYGLPNRKYVSRVLIRLEIGDAALPTVELSRDGGAWETLPCTARTNADDAKTGSIVIPIRPRRCERFRIRVSGVGTYKLTGITKTIEESGR